MMVNEDFMDASPLSGRGLVSSRPDLFSPIPRRWGSLGVTGYSCTASELLRETPAFERLKPDGQDQLGENRSLNMIVRCGDRGRKPVPVGMVSPRYRLFQHRDLIERVGANLARVGVNDPPVRAVVTPEWERVFLCFDLGGFLSTSPDGYPVNLQLWVRNSVDGSAAMKIDLGWLRLVCSNGLIVGRSLGHTRTAHVIHSSLEEAFRPIKDGLARARLEADTMNRWADTPVREVDLVQWVDRELSSRWGPLAAARALHIWKTGFDARSIPPFEKVPASCKALEPTHPVPGAPQTPGTLYDVLQILSWIASRRAEFFAAQSAQQEIGKLLAPLAKTCIQKPQRTGRTPDEGVEK